MGIALLCLLVMLTAQARAGDPIPHRRPARIEAATPAGRRAVARLGVAIDAVGDGAVWAWLTEAEADALRQAGFPVTWEAVTLDFPPEDSAYHDYQETLDDLASLAAAYPDLTRLVTIGTSWEGRLLQGIKITDRPDEDEGEPEALFFALTHGREHLSTEQALYIAHHFAEGYGQDPAVTNLVNHRVIWVFPNVNPDGGEYDIQSGSGYEEWRKNRRANYDGSFGVDLNRNYGYMWGCCGGSSPWPGAPTYRGPAPFSEPETQAIRDFVLAHPAIRVSMSLHTSGEWILWPWGYTGSPVPDPVDRATFEALGQAMAATNGYRPMQAYDLYVTDGISDDWLYGEQGIIAFTFELYPPGAPNFYPGDEVIPVETARNRAAVELLTALAQDPRRAGGGPGDVISPTVALTVTTRYWPLSSPLTLTAQAGDDVGVTLVSLGESLTETTALRAAPPYTWTVPGADSPAVRTFTARAFDRAHNWSASAPISLAMGLPHGVLTPTLLTVTVPAGGVQQVSLEVANAGYGTLNWSLADPGPGWLAVTPTGGEVVPGAVQPLTLTLTAPPPPAQVYTGTVAFAWDDPFVPQAAAQVTLVAITPPRAYLPLAQRAR